MSDPLPVSNANPPPSADPGAVAKPAEKKPPKPSFAFTDPGCRTEVRLGILLVLAGIFVWLWLGPTVSTRLILVGLPLVLIGIPIQAIQARRGRPGYPWKLALTLTVFGALMWPGFSYRERYDAPVHVQLVAPVVLGCGVWMLLWWPVAGFRRRAAVGPTP